MLKGVTIPTEQPFTMDGSAVVTIAGRSLALRGRDKVQEASPPIPEQTVETVKEDVQWAKTQRQSAGT